MNRKEANQAFDHAIWFDRRKKVEKELYNLTAGFTMSDWAAMRTKQFWATFDHYSNRHDKNEYLLDCVRKYLSL